LGHLYIKCIVLPRQARDKHRENSTKVPFSRSLQAETSLLGSATRSLAAAAAGAGGQDAAAAAAAGQAAPAAKRRRRSSGSSGGSGGVAPERTHEEDALGESLQRAKAAAEAARAKGSPVEAAEERCETQSIIILCSLFIIF
jgi:hypothetical protein